VKNSATIFVPTQTRLHPRQTLPRRAGKPNPCAWDITLAFRGASTASPLPRAYQPTTTSTTSAPCTTTTTTATNPRSTTDTQALECTLQPRQLRDGESPWAPRQFYSGILPCTPLHQRFPFPGVLIRKPQGQDPLVEKGHLVNWNGIPIYFHPLTLWMKVMVPSKLKALQLQH
jgi:hypothetical protein